VGHPDVSAWIQLSGFRGLLSSGRHLLVPSPEHSDHKLDWM
jgi:hypothetical protein